MSSLTSSGVEATRALERRFAAPMPRFRGLALLVLLPMLPACSWIFHGKRQAVEFSSDSDHERFTVDGAEYHTPATIELERGKSHEVRGPAGERVRLESGCPVGYVLMDLPAYLMWLVTIPLNPTQALAPYEANCALDHDAVHFGPSVATTGR